MQPPAPQRVQQHILLSLFALCPRCFCCIPPTYFLSPLAPPLAVWHSIWGFYRCCNCSLRSLLCCFSANVNQLLIVKIMNDLHGLPQSCTAPSLFFSLSFPTSLSLAFLPSLAWGLSLALRQPWGHLISTTCTIAWQLAICAKS